MNRRSELCSQRRQKAEERGLLWLCQAAEAACGTGALPIMRKSILPDGGCTAVMQEARARSETPKRRRSPILPCCPALCHSIIEGGTHVVQQQVRIEWHIISISGSQR